MNDLLVNFFNAFKRVIVNDLWCKCLKSGHQGGNSWQVKYDRLYNRRFDNIKINRFIDTSTFKSSVQAAADSLTTFLKNPTFGIIDWVAEARKDRFEGALANIRDIDGAKQRIKYFLIRTGLKQ